jgi:hypothetical protein
MLTNLLPMTAGSAGKFITGEVCRDAGALGDVGVAGQINCRMRQELWLQQSSGQKSFILDRKWPFDSELIRLLVFDCD